MESLRNFVLGHRSWERGGGCFDIYTCECGSAPASDIPYFSEIIIMK